MTSTGIRVVHLQQYFQGLRVYRAARVIKYERGRPARITSAGLDSLSPSTRTTPRVRASRAVEEAITFLQRRGAVPRSLRLRLGSEQRFNLVSRPMVLSGKGDLAEPIRAHLEIFPATRGPARLAWVLEIALCGRGRYEVVVSADSARPVVLFSTQSTSCLDFDASCIRFPTDGPVLGQFPLPTFEPPFVSLALSPSNWLSAAGTASGPNVVCHDGTNDDPHALGRPEIENAFVWCNFLRDFFASFGFDDSLGAFSGVDPLQVRVFVSKSEQGGRFDNRVDGTSPRMDLFAAKSAGGHHAALDPSILVHEYAHGVSNRLLGGAAEASPFAGTQAQGLNEGYSDYFALTVVSFVDRANGGSRDLRRIGSAFKRPGGIRDYTAVADRFATNIKDKYALARIWCAALLDARGLLTGPQGLTPDQADRFLWQALLDSLKAMAPICPHSNCLTFSHAKDALLTASAAREAALTAAFRGSTTAIGAALTNRNIA